MDGLELIKIHNWTFDPVKKTLKPDITENNESRANVSEEISLEAKQADLLLCLIQQTGQIVSRDMLLEQVWNNRYVDDTTINATVSRLRKLLGGAKYQYIKTHPKLGYSFCAEVDYIERPKTHYSTKEKILSLKAIKIYATIITVALFAIVTYLFSIAQESDKTLLPKDVKIEPLTYMEGREFGAVLSKNEKLLAFAHQVEMDDYSNLIVQNLETSNYISIEPNNESSSPFWVEDPEGNSKLYYVSGEENKCLVKRVNVDENLNLYDLETVAECSIDYTNAPIAITRDESFLYYVYYSGFPNPTVIHRKSLISGETKQLTVPSTNYLGDYFFSLSPNEEYLVFERSNDTFLANLMHLNLATGELVTLIENTGFLEGLVWLPSSDKLLYISEEFAIEELDIESKERKTIYQSNVHLEDLYLTLESELLVSIGNRYHSNVASINLQTLESSILVESSFRDFDGQKSLLGNSTYFISTRSGNYQIWRKDEDGRLTQLTEFSEKSRIEELTISPSGKYILFKRGKELSYLTVNTGEVTLLRNGSAIFNDSVWECKSDEKFFVTAKIGMNWYLLSYNITSKQFNEVMKDVISIANYCEKNEKYIALQDKSGVYLLLPENSLPTKTSGLEHQYVSSNLEWAVGSKGFYHIDEDGRITLENKADKDTSLLIKIQDARFRLSGNQLIYNDVYHNNTYIGKITILND